MNIKTTTNRPIKGKICRICLEKRSEEMLNIRANHDPENLSQIIEKCGGIQLFVHDILPSYICRICLTNLKVANEFRSLCQKSQIVLFKMLCAEFRENAREQSDCETAGEPIILQNTTIDAYLPIVGDQENRTIFENSSTEETQFTLEFEENASEQNDCEMAGEPLIQNKPIDTYLPIVGDQENRTIFQNSVTVATQSTLEIGDVIFPIVLHPTEEESATQTGFDEDDENAVVATKAIITDDEIIDTFDFKSNSDSYISVLEDETIPEPIQSDPNIASVGFQTDDEQSPNTDTIEKDAKEQDTSTVHGLARLTYVCYICGNLHKDKDSFGLHLNSHYKPFQCNICLKRFTQNKQLSRHMNSHTGLRPYKCQYCVAKFGDPSTKSKHERIHTKVRPYSCTICNKKFAYSHVLKVHNLTHTGVKPFSCDLCGKRFSQLHHKKSHIRTHEKKRRKTGT